MTTLEFSGGELIETPSPATPTPVSGTAGAAQAASRSARPPRQTVQARTRLTKKSLVKRGHLEPGSADADAAAGLMEMQREASRARAALLRRAAGFWVDRDDPEQSDDREEKDLAVAIALRTTTPKATTLLGDAHTAVVEMPETFARLALGDLPVEWHDKLLKSVRNLTPFQRAEVDELISEWDLASLPADRFHTAHRLLLAWFDADGARPRPENSRDVALERSGHDDGIACLRITGPIPEIHSLAKRLDAAARAVHAEQRHALDDGSPIPFDLDGDVAQHGSAMNLAALRYAIL
ncbi:DUF222 domain-containing protein, partial [Brachybacterium sp. FME24]|uniref:DUF222 domain-containing protein n=1 Tax=Brachybacterium sp. FME24 TaxID=2742605 RepID=UPI0018696801